MRDKLRALTHGSVRHLGGTLQLSAREPARFRRAVERYTVASENPTAGAFWPLVRLVKLRSRRWTSLRAGTVLVDAPGLHDDNAARDAVVRRGGPRARPTSSALVTPLLLAALLHLLRHGRAAHSRFFPSLSPTLRRLRTLPSADPPSASASSG